MKNPNAISRSSSFGKAVMAALLIPSLTAAMTAQAAQKEDITQFSLEDLLKAETTVASEKPMTRRETPGVVTLITREEIQRSGARDLEEILLMVPGFYFGVDVHSVIGAGFRGNWGHEGKILVLVDGQEMNEGSYTTTQFGQHFPADVIEKVEIIRGPGSALYGGAAELAVINVTTRIGADFGGSFVSANVGATADALARHNYTGIIGGKPTDDSYVGASFHLGRGIHSDRNYTDFYGTTVNMEDASFLNPVNVNLKGEYKGFRLRFMLDHYGTRHQDSFDAVLPARIHNDYRSYFTDVSYAWKPTGSVTITPLFNYRRQHPWNSPDGNPATAEYYERTVDRYQGSLKGAWQATDELHLTAGTMLEFTHATEDSRYQSTFPASFVNGRRSITYRNVAVYGQGLFRHEIANVTAGLRFENHEQYGSSFAPRVAITRAFGPFYLKGLYSRAFRSPSLENIELSPAIQQEKTNVFEAEGGVEIGSYGLFSVNFFDITIEKPIVYNFDPVTSTESYQNFNKTGSRGVESELSLRHERVYASATYSFYHTAGKNRVPAYQIPGRSDMLLAFPGHKITFNGGVVPLEGLSINPSLVFMSARYGYGAVTGGGTQLIRKYDPVTLLNLFVRYDGLFIPPLSVGAGIRNLLNENAVYIQPYDGYHPPLPGQSREFIFHLSLQMDGWRRAGESG